MMDLFHGSISRRGSDSATGTRENRFRCVCSCTAILEYGGIWNVFRREGPGGGEDLVLYARCVLTMLGESEIRLAQHQ
jgi:hypothetical protein